MKVLLIVLVVVLSLVFSNGMLGLDPCTTCVYFNTTCPFNCPPRNCDCTNPVVGCVVMCLNGLAKSGRREWIERGPILCCSTLKFSNSRQMFALLGGLICDNSVYDQGARVT
ncbi:hypothetical protein BgiBS90_007115 [Biomphalaria glabrata]|nr:hypothetical protein BgiBS90_007115 [Biomphalaria glabrata]